MSDPAVIRVDGAVKRFGRVTAVDGVALRVPAGQVVGLLGANGAGKTTLIKAILGLQALDAGCVRVFGRAPSRSTRSRLGYVPQGLGLYTDLSVRQNIEFVAGAFGVAVPPLPAALAAAARRQVKDIGLGLQRQLAFSCALLHEPELLVLDEPTSGVDPLARARLWDTVHEQAEAGVAVLVTTHNMREAEQCDDLLLLSRGRAVASGGVVDLVAGIRTVRVITSSWAAAFEALSAAAMPVTLAGRDVRVAGVQAGRVDAVLAAAGLDATVQDVPATLEETMVLVDRSAPPH